MQVQIRNQILLLDLSWRKLFWKTDKRCLFFKQKHMFLVHLHFGEDFPRQFSVVFFSFEKLCDSYGATHDCHPKKPQRYHGTFFSLILPTSKTFTRAEHRESSVFPGGRFHLWPRVPGSACCFLWGMKYSPPMRGLFHKLLNKDPYLEDHP